MTTESLGSQRTTSNGVGAPATGSSSDGDWGDGPKASEGAADLKDELTEATSDLAEKGEEIADAGRERAAEGIEHGAQMLKEQAGDGTAGAVADKAAEGMERTAQYLRERGTAEMWDDVETYVRSHPVQGIAGAVAAGFLVGRIIR